MADGYWNQQRQQHHPPGGPMKRPRSDFEAPSSTMTIGHGGGYYPRDEDLDVPDTRTIGSAYDRYLQSVQSGEGGSVSMGRSGGGGGGGGNVQTIDDFMLRRGGVLPLDHGPNGHTIGFDPPEPVGRRNLPSDASNTLYVEGLPSNCSRREVARILFYDTLQVFFFYGNYFSPLSLTDV
jgi:hypothetical protein